MQILETVDAMRAAVHARRASVHAKPASGRNPRLAHTPSHSLGLVPTMGALHAGHLSLLQRARQECEIVAATIFVNPMQFAPGEDFDRYPRSTKIDCELLERAGVDLVFLPSVAEMYPPGATVSVEVGALGERLDGKHRPGHFRGVATIVAKLFNIVEPQIAYFGQKDAVQIAVLRQMLRDLNFGLTLTACETVRDPDGLAMSSRNAYLSTTERAQALILPRALKAMQAALASGTRDASAVLCVGRDVLEHEPAVNLEFLEAVNSATLMPITQVLPGTLVALAARIGKTRLIDNFLAQ